MTREQQTIIEAVLACSNQQALRPSLVKGAITYLDYIECPACRTDYVHHESSAVTIAGNDNYEASKIVRGDVVAIPMYCEEGHKFIRCLGFHKGNVATWAVRNGRMNREDSVE